MEGEWDCVFLEKRRLCKFPGVGGREHEPGRSIHGGMHVWEGE